MLSMALILSSLTVVIKINLVSFRAILFLCCVIEDYLMMWASVCAFVWMHSIRSTYRIFIMFIVSSVYAPKSCRTSFHIWTAYRSNWSLPIKSVSIWIALHSRRWTSLKIRFGKPTSHLHWSLFAYNIKLLCSVLLGFSAMLSYVQCVKAKANKKSACKKTTEKKQRSEHQIDRYASERTRGTERQLRCRGFCGSFHTEKYLSI